MEALDNLMGPLYSMYCIYFYIAGLVALAGAVLAAVGVIPCLMDKKKQQYCIHLVMLSIQMLLGYLMNRLLYNMCTK